MIFGQLEKLPRTLGTKDPANQRGPEHHHRSDWSRDRDTNRRSNTKRDLLGNGRLFP